MIYELPKLGKEAIPLPHFPTKHQAFIFRACEYVPVEKLATILRTTSENIRAAMCEMGLPEYDPGDLWLQKGYITIIRRMWHILPYSQLLELVGMDEETLAVILREEDFLDVKLGDKPICEPVLWRELTDEERHRTAEIREILREVSVDGKPPFAFEYSVPKLRFEGAPVFETRMIYAFSGLYQHAFDVDSRLFCPDEQLEAYRDLGINGIWTQGVLSQLTEFPFAPSLSKGYRERLRRMREFTERLAKYDIKLYLYINEPRSMPLSFFDDHPELRGHERRGNASLCTSTEAVQNYLRDAIETVCRAVPLIGGFFTITRSENMTNCYSHSGSGKTVCTCPRCKERSVGEVVGEVIGCILDGARRVSPDIKVMAWSWAWKEHTEDIIRHLPKGVILLSQSELAVPYEIGGVKGNVVDYSMSIIGPGEQAKREWALAKECGLETCAKVQINTTWEASTVPALPVSPSVEAHMEALKEEGVRHLMLSWTLGGYPSANIASAAKYFFERCESPESDPILRRAEEQFTRAFREFPFHITVLYLGPQNAGPSNLLFEKPTGYKATMTGFAYDDLESWRAVYPVDVFEDQLRRLCEQWALGLDMIKEHKDSETAVMARAAYCIFRSVLNQTRFIRARDGGRREVAKIVAEDELKVTQCLLDLMNQNAAIGYEAANHYYFSKGQLIEKILCCHHMIGAFGNGSV